MVKSKKEFPIEWVFGVAVFLAFLLVGAAFYWPSEEKYQFESVEGGILFASNVEHPTQILKENFLDASDFIVSLDYVQGNAANSQLGQAMVLLTEVLTVQHKKVSIVVRSLDGEGNVLACQTNDANKHANRSISREECLKLFENTSTIDIFVHYPDSSLPRSKVVLDLHTAHVFPKIPSDSANASYILLKTMYSDTDSIVAAINAYYQAAVQGGE